MTELDPNLLKLLVCPVDKQSLDYVIDQECLYNQRRRIRYPIRNGIPVLLEDESTKLDDSEHERIVASISLHNAKTKEGK